MLGRSLALTLFTSLLFAVACGVGGGGSRRDGGAFADADPGCNGTRIRCAGECIDPASDTRFCGAGEPCTGNSVGTVCDGEDLCVSGRCISRCPAGQLECGARCVDPLADRSFCGATGSCVGTQAGVMCASGTVCVAGQCVASCPSGQIDCGGQCVNPMTDRVYCGAKDACAGIDIGTPCATGQVCVDGACVTSCPQGQIACQGQCIDPKTDPIFCGAEGACEPGQQGASCGPGEVCNGGVCRTSCPSGQVACGGRCVDPSSDPVFCGATGNCGVGSRGQSCIAGEVCKNGSCILTCPDGQVPCGGRCIDPLTDRTHCGASASCVGPTAGVPCTAGELCVAGACELNCTAGQVLCDRGCIDPMTDRTYCGASGDCMGTAAGSPCGAGAVCSGGVCALSCGGGLDKCGNQCVDTQSNPDFCGGCAGLCTRPANGTAVCIQGDCSHVCDDGYVDCNDDISSDGCESQPDIDAENCGRCGNVCPSETQAVAGCGGGACTLTCAPGFLDCDRDLGTGGTGCESVGSQCPTAYWWQAYGDNTDDRSIRDMASDAGGNVYVLGHYEGAIPVNGTTMVSARYGAYLAKFDAAGALIWVRNIASTEQDAVAERIVLDAAGDVYVVGYWFRGNLTVGATTVANSGSERSFVAKLDSNGAVKWGRDLVNGRARGAALQPGAPTSDGLVVTGSFNATESVDGIALNHSGSTADGFVTRLNTQTGAVTVAFAFGGAAADELPNGITAFSNGDLALVGSYRGGTASIAGRPLVAGGMNDAFATVLASNGTSKWVMALNGAASEDLWDVHGGAAGEVYVAGHNGSGAYLARHRASDGTLDWSGAMAGGNSFAGIERMVLFGGRVLSAFQFLGTGSFGTASLAASTNAGVVLEVDGANGTVLGASAYAFGNPTRFNAIAPRLGGGTVVGGSFSGTITLDAAAVPHAGDWDHLVVALYPL